MPDYTTLLTVSAAALMLVGLGWLVMGKAMLKRWQLVPNAVGLLVGRRIGAIYLGVAVLLLALRRVTAPEEQLAVCAGGAALASLLAVVGIYEFLRKRVGPGILVGVVGELALAAAFTNLLMA